MQSYKALGHLFTFITIAIWSTAFVGNKVLLAYLTPIEITYATGIARMIYYSKLGKIDNYDIVSQAIYWKNYYNTSKGKGTVDEYLDKWKTYVNDDLYSIWAY